MPSIHLWEDSGSIFAVMEYTIQPHAHRKRQTRSWTHLSFIKWMWHILIYDSFPWTKRRGHIYKRKFCQHLQQPSGSSWTPQCGCTLESWACVICGARLARHCPPPHHHFLRYLCDSLLLHCCHCHRLSAYWCPPHRHLGGSVASFWTWPARRSAPLQTHILNYQRLCTLKHLWWYSPRNLWRCTVLLINCERSMLYTQAGIYHTCGSAVIIAILIREADSIFIASVFVVTFNLTHPVFFFTLTFLTAMTGVPLFTQLGETIITGVGLERLSARKWWWGAFLDSPGIFCHSCLHSHTARWVHRPCLSAQSHHCTHILAYTPHSACSLGDRSGVCMWGCRQGHKGRNDCWVDTAVLEKQDKIVSTSLIASFFIFFFFNKVILWTLKEKIKHTCYMSS